MHYDILELVIISTQISLFVGVGLEFQLQHLPSVFKKDGKKFWLLNFGITLLIHCTILLM